jgi:hypothetical protein
MGYNLLRNQRGGGVSRQQKISLRKTGYSFLSIRILHRGKSGRMSCATTSRKSEGSANIYTPTTQTIEGITDPSGIFHGSRRRTKRTTSTGPMQLEELKVRRCLTVTPWYVVITSELIERIVRDIQCFHSRNSPHDMCVGLYKRKRGC